MWFLYCQQVDTRGQCWVASTGCMLPTEGLAHRVRLVFQKVARVKLGAIGASKPIRRVLSSIFMSSCSRPGWPMVVIFDSMIAPKKEPNWVGASALFR